MSIMDCSYCNALFDFCELVGLLVEDIIHLEAELVSTRYELCQYLKEPHNEFLHSDIFSSLARRYSGNNNAYDTYVKLFCANQDPMETDEKNEHIWKLSRGICKYNI
jgi:hypothetical protein